MPTPPRAALFITVMLFAVPSPRAAPPTVDMDVASARRLLTLACSGAPVDSGAFERSALLRRQLAHHAAFGPQFTLENYLAGVRAIAACRRPEPDPFRFSGLVDDPDRVAAALDYLTLHEAALLLQVSSLLAPYVPQDVDFRGSVVFVAASFSCGGFAQQDAFFVDLQCVADDMAGNADAIARLIAHETYHALQHEIGFAAATASAVADEHGALAYLLSNLVEEGTATHVGRPLATSGHGRYARFARAQAQAQAHERHMQLDFVLLDVLVDYLQHSPLDLPARLANAEQLGFAGAYDEHLYYAGARMASVIEQEFGAATLACLVGRHPARFVLAYARAAEQGDATAPRLAPATLAAAARLAAQGPQAAARDACFEPA